MSEEPVSTEQLLAELEADAGVASPPAPPPEPEVMPESDNPQPQSQPQPLAQATPDDEITAAAAASVLADFERISAEILGNFRNDRTQAEDIIQHLWGIVREQHGVAAQHYVQGLVAALGVKVEVNANATKILEAKAKLLSAGKGTVFNINNATGMVSNQELDTLLSRPVERVQ